MPQLIDVELERLNRRLKKHDIWLEITDQVRDFVASKGFDKRFGARGLRRAIRRYLEFPLASYLLGDDGNFSPPNGSSIVRLQANYQDGTVTFSQD
jgi:ATP-dependent Clp protease ATP-binding subunit ClpA